jgi:hypothetical protein
VICGRNSPFEKEGAMSKKSKKRDGGAQHGAVDSENQQNANKLGKKEYEAEL